MVRTIWDKVFFKIIVSVDELLIWVKVFSESSHHIYTNIDVVEEVIFVNISFTSELCLDAEFIEL